MSTDLHARLLADLDDYEAAMPQPGSLIDALRAVVELHVPQPRLNGTTGELMWIECAGCLDDAPSWPCSTIRVIADALGVKDEELIEKESPTNA